MAQIDINKNRCKGCGMCVITCPYNVLKMTDKAINNKGVHYAEIQNPDVCRFCGMCVQICPDLAIELTKSRS